MIKSQRILIAIVLPLLALILHTTLCEWGFKVSFTSFRYLLVYQHEQQQTPGLRRGQIHCGRIENRYFPPDGWPEKEWSRLSGRFDHDGSTFSHPFINCLIAETVSLACAANRLGCSSSDVQKLVKDGALGGLCVNRLWRVSKYHLADYQRQKLPPESAVP